MTPSTCAVDWNGRKWPIGGGMGHGWCLDHCTMRSCFFDEVVFLVYFMQRPLGAQGTHFFFQKTGDIWNLRCLEKRKTESKYDKRSRHGKELFW
jgi:hypothetical protein